jgi:hypothetical protein
MKRREFITLLAGATAWPFGGRQLDLSIADRFIFRRKWLWDVYRYQRRGSCAVANVGKPIACATNPLASSNE